MAKTIYLDNAATTPVDKNVVKAMEGFMLIAFGNASSSHVKGQEAKRALEEARHVIAKSMGAKDDEIYFTSGGTEANNWAIKGLFFANKKNKTGKNHIITTKIEHDCVLNACKWIEKQGGEVTYLDVDKEGKVNPVDVEKAITNKTILVSMIHGNNEVGTIQDIDKIGRICKDKGVHLHIDACQSYTKTDLNVRKTDVDLITLNAHKIHGPKGVGALYIREGIKIDPLLHGGGHEKGFRSGTENIPGVMGFARAVKNARSKHIKHMTILRDQLIKGILKIPNTKLNGPRGKDKDRLCNNVNVSFNNIEGEAIGGYLEAYGICSSTGSACSSHSLEASHVLKAMGLTDLQSNTSLRLSISKYTTKEEIEYVLDKLPKIVEKLRKISPFK